ncbi:MAG: hypothetical protein E3J81_04505 [Dehalococcoidia bacterium]|nr:MAG: hypothetical protein E3J81_04505 [Dehalococcoidia bacterium]
MKRTLSSLMLVVLVVGVMAPTVGSTLATFSDSEVSQDNFITTGSLDLKVDDRDDEPWGSGVGPVSQISDAMVCTLYNYSVPVWNAGDADAVAYLEIKNLVDPEGLSLVMHTEIWYDGILVTSGWMSDLAGQQIELGDLPANAYRDVTMVLHATGGSPGDRLEYGLQFEVMGPWSDTEVSQGNYFQLVIELGGTPGFWRSPAALRLYGKSQIAAWFRAVVLDSAWLEDGLANGTDDAVYAKLRCILANTGAKGYTGAVNQFLAQYVATRLNAESGRLGLGTAHDISGIPGATACFGYSSGGLSEIIATIESKADGPIFSNPPERDEILIMKSVCDALNNP